MCNHECEHASISQPKISYQERVCPNQEVSSYRCDCKVTPTRSIITYERERCPTPPPKTVYVDRPRAPTPPPKIIYKQRPRQPQMKDLWRLQRQIEPAFHQNFSFNVFLVLPTGISSILNPWSNPNLLKPFLNDVFILNHT